MTLPDVNKNCPHFPHSGSVGCLPAPNIFHLANEFAKGKMFWNHDNGMAYILLFIVGKLQFILITKKHQKL